jgi:proton glutamate symport protein
METTQATAVRAAAPSSAALSIRIFAALVIGLALGAALAVNRIAGLDTLLAIAGPVGKLWLDALTMTVVPLVFGLLVSGTASATGSVARGGVTRRAILWFAAMLLAACALSALVATALLAIWPVDPATAALTGAVPGGSAAPSPPSAPGDWLGNLIPTNPIRAAADTAMVPLVFFALLFGFAAGRIEPSLRDSLVTLSRAIVQAMLVIVQWVLWLAPIGVFALAFGVGARLGLGAAATLIQYVLVVAACCLAAALLASLLGVIFGRISPVRFVRAALPAQIVALSTQSSLAALPAMVRAAPALEVEQADAGIVLPMAVSLFRAASAAANIAVAIYLAHLHGIALTLPGLAVGVAVAAAVSLAAVGLPAQVSFFATIAPVCVALGVPVVLLPVLLAVETVPDIFRTFGNVTADLAAVRLAGRRGQGG